jgi:hypothetical protein
MYVACHLMFRPDGICATEFRVPVKKVHQRFASVALQFAETVQTPMARVDTSHTDDYQADDLGTEDYQADSLGARAAEPAH